MNVAEKVGQLFVVAAPPDDHLVRCVRDHHVGGVIWLPATARHARAVTAQLQALAKTPLLVSADLESGLGMRMTDATWWPPAMAVAATGDPRLAYEMGRITAVEASAVGINHILAPVADVNVDPANPVINTRSFGAEAHEVARYVAEFVRGVQSEGLLATAKHFPGHGDTRVDSHRALPVLDVTRERLDAVELVPFRAAIEAGVATVMIGHLAVPVLDPTLAPVIDADIAYGTHADEVTHGGTLPATVSSRVIVDLLRGELGFQGLVVSDAFDMGGVASHFDAGEAAVRAIEAGMDQILMPADVEMAIAAVHAAVASGRIGQARLDEAVERVLEAKRRVRFEPADFALIDRAEHLALAEEIARKAVQVVRDEHGLLPLRGNVETFVATDYEEENPLGELRDARFIGPRTAFEEIRGLGESADVLVLALAARPKSGAGRISVPPAAQELFERFARKTVVISFGSPYILADAPTYIRAYGIQPVLQRAALRLLHA
ncbi:MAG TPA: glycoside hydrolase family 3 protein [Thermoanaerobaculia bacterium]|jgi:beta-glucosidase-like glycosyl hydrolase